MRIVFPFLMAAAFIGACFIGACSEAVTMQEPLDGASAADPADAGYRYALMGSTPDDVLCVYQESIAGPVDYCLQEQYRTMFSTILAHLDEPDLGLEDTHRVDEIDF